MQRSSDSKDRYLVTEQIRDELSRQREHNEHIHTEEIEIEETGSNNVIKVTHFGPLRNKIGESEVERRYIESKKNDGHLQEKKE